MKSVLVIVTRQIGDVLLTTPLLRAARARWPEATIDVLGLAGTLGMLRGNPDVSRCIEVEPVRSAAAALALARRLWRRYELALIAEASDRAHLLGFVAAPLRAGLVPAEPWHAWWKRLLLRHAVVVAGDRGERHVVAEKLALLDPWRGGAPGSAAAAPAAGAPVGAPATPPVVEAPAAPVAPPGAALPDDIERALDAAPVVVQAPSMWRYKQWPIGHFRVVVETLLADGRQVVLTGGPGDSDKAKVAALAALAAPPHLIDACGRLDFNQLATLLARAALYIGPDTSVTHLAAATGVPVIALFGPTDPRRWGPVGAGRADAVRVGAGSDGGGDGAGSDGAGFARRGLAPQQRRNVVLLQGPGGCVPCGRAGCADQRGSASACLEAIAPADVLAEAARLLAGRPGPVDRP